MALPVSASLVEEAGSLTFNLFNLPDQAALDALVVRFVARSDAWMQGHLGANYGLTTPAYAPVLQEEGQIYLTLEKLVATLKAEKTYGSHFPYMSEDSPAYQALIDTDWGERAMAALDLWVTPEIAGRGFALPVFLATTATDKNTDCTLKPFSQILSEELDWARGISDPDIGTVRR